MPQRTASRFWPSVPRALPPSQADGILDNTSLASPSLPRRRSPRERTLPIRRGGDILATEALAAAEMAAEIAHGNGQESAERRASALKADETALALREHRVRAEELETTYLAALAHLRAINPETYRAFVSHGANVNKIAEKSVRFYALLAWFQHLPLSVLRPLKALVQHFQAEAALAVALNEIERELDSSRPRLSQEERTGRLDFFAQSPGYGMEQSNVQRSWKVGEFMKKTFSEEGDEAEYLKACLEVHRVRLLQERDDKIRLWVPDKDTIANSRNVGGNQLMYPDFTIEGVTIRFTENVLQAYNGTMVTLDVKAVLDEIVELQGTLETAKGLQFDILGCQTTVHEIRALIAESDAADKPLEEEIKNATEARDHFVGELEEALRALKEENPFERENREVQETETEQ